jgi:hypothetical protein
MGANESRKDDLTLAVYDMIDIIPAVRGSREEPLNPILFYKKIRVL